MEQALGMCPFLKQQCIKEKCELFQVIPVQTPGRLVGTANVGTMGGCSVNLASLFLSRFAAFPAAPPGKPANS